MPFRRSTKLTAVVLLSALLFAIGCTDTSESGSEPEQEISEYTAQGRVLRILENSRLIQVAHGDIEGFMPAMSMPFEFRADSIRAAISEGDSIHFRIASDGIDNWIVQVTVIE